MYFDLLNPPSGEHIDVVRDLDSPIDDMLLTPPGPFHHSLPTMGEGAVLFLDARYDLAALQATHELPAELHTVWDTRIETLSGRRLDEVGRSIEKSLGTNQTPRFFQAVLREALSDLSLDLQFLSGRAKQIVKPRFYSVLPADLPILLTSIVFAAPAHNNRLFH